MSRSDLDDVFILATSDTLKVQLPDGGLGSEPWIPMLINIWSICYLHPLHENPHYRSRSLLDAIIRLGDYNERNFHAERGFTDGNAEAWDEWRIFAWLEAAERLAAEIDPERLARWRAIFQLFARRTLSHCIDMEHFDGAIPNHGIWAHALMHRVGQLYGCDDLRSMAEYAFERILAGQTPDGCFREGGTAVGFPGSPVVLYNVVSLMAVNMYAEQSKNPAAVAALGAGFRWWWNTRFPDFSDICVFDCRNKNHSESFGAEGATIHPLVIPAYYFNQPPVQEYARRGWIVRGSTSNKAIRKTVNTGPYQSQALGFLSLQWDKIKDDVVPSAPEWPELFRFTALEAGVRRRNGWHVALSGIANAGASSYVLPTWRLERQSLLAIWHEKIGLIVGSGNSLMQEQNSTMTFYENGCARYLHDEAYLKTTPGLDTLHLRYGANTGAVSVDTRSADTCTVIFSILGEAGKRSQRGTGHPVSAMAARGRLPLHLKAGEVVRIGERELILDDFSGIRVRVGAGEVLRCGAWSLCCQEKWWDFIWPVMLSNAYKPLFPDEVTAIAEVTLWDKATTEQPSPTVTFTIRPLPA